MNATPDADTQLRLFREMLRIRRVEERVAERYPDQQMRCPTHLSIGQEAVPVGVSAHLNDRDYALGGHRSHAHYLAKGGDLKAFVAELYGKATGCAGGRGGSMHLIDLSAGFLGSTPIVGSTIPIAVGTAFATMLRREDRVTAIYFGEGAVEEGVFHESLNFACLKKLPVLFVCENNLYSVYSPMSVRQPANREVAQLAAGHGLEAHQADGNDVLEVYGLAGRSIASIRNGSGPVFLEFKTYRWREHCGPFYDNELGYRPVAEFEEWQRRCPIETFCRRLLEEGVLSRAALTSIEQGLQSEIDEAFRFALASPFPDPSTLMRYVYAT